MRRPSERHPDAPAGSAPSPDRPLRGRCACGAVRFRVTRPFRTAGYCHCHRCRRRSGAPFSLNALVEADGVEITTGSGSLRSWRPEPTVRAKFFCARCGGHLFAGDPGRDRLIAVRIGALEEDPAIEPTWHAWTSSAPAWLPIPDDGLGRFAQGRAQAEPAGGAGQESSGMPW
ncbi:MAG: GFA family protein [Solirubrobacterales bacterium]